MVVPILEDLLGWSEFETSLFFCGAGVEVHPITFCVNNFIHCFTYEAYHVIYCVNTSKQKDNRQVVLHVHVYTSSHLTHMYITIEGGYC